MLLFLYYYKNVTDLNFTEVIWGFIKVSGMLCYVFLRFITSG